MPGFQSYRSRRRSLLLEERRTLERVQTYPVDILKIDRSFIDGPEHDAGKSRSSAESSTLARICR